MPDPVLICTWVPIADANGVLIPKEETVAFFSSITYNSPWTRVFVITEEFGFRADQEYGAERVRCLLQLLGGPGVPSHVILTDMRDVVVQKDLRDFPIDRLGFHLEAKGTEIGGCEYNGRWIRDFYGDAMFDRLAGEQISNVSMVSGPTVDVLAYLHSLDSLMQAARPASQKRWATGVDMAAHNVLVWTTKHGGVVDWTEPPIYTCGSMDKIEVEHHIILDRKGDRPFMVHQYDRHVRHP